MKKIYFNSFMHIFNFGLSEYDFTCLYIGKRTFFLVSNRNRLCLKISTIGTIRINKGVIFSDIIIMSNKIEYKLVRVPSLKALKIKKLLEYCLVYGNLKKEFALYDSVTNETQYVAQSLEKRVLRRVEISMHSGLIRYKDLPFDREKKKECKKYIKLYKNFIKHHKEIVLNNNKNFIKKELISYKKFFDTIEKNPLTEKQRVAIITNEDNNLIVAGAGSGKTSVIVGKVLYLLEKHYALPNEILILAFNKKAQKELKDRLSEKLSIIPDVRTFHGMGNTILKQCKENKALSKVASDDWVLKNSIKAIIQNNLDQEDFMEIIKLYFQEFFYPAPNIFSFKSEGDYYNYLENYEIRTLNGERVRSLEECYIANYLYLNGIKYEYEAQYEYCNDSVYRPDFYLVDFDVYIEHFAINKDNTTPEFIDSKEYIEGIKWKRNIHKKYKTNLIETYSWEAYYGILFTNLKNKLKKFNVEFCPINKNEIFKKFNNETYMDSFTELTLTFLNHYKSNQYKMTDLFKNIEKRMQNYDAEKDFYEICRDKRNKAFLEVFKVISKDYEKQLKSNNEVDFNDMILLATNLIKLCSYKPKYKYILVDEFQDISQGRGLFLKTMCQNKNIKLFCVGDDWQSIYRFTGSDISLMTNFAQEFGAAETVFLDMTFRFDNQINNVATKFVTQNDSQLKKEISTVKKKETPSVLIYYENPDEQDSLEIILQEIMNDIQDPTKNKVAILSRFNKIKQNKNDENTEYFKERLKRLQIEYKDLEIEFSTVHSSKGLGFDYVILMDMYRGAFPVEKIDDHILNMVMPKPEKYPNAEERRLFYVALTRAKEKVYLISNSKPSSFIEELENGDYNIGVYGDSESLIKLHCPKCKTGLLIKSKTQKSFRCSHTNYCDFRIPVCDNCGKGYIYFDKVKDKFICTNPDCKEEKNKCPQCEDGYLIKRNGKYGLFLGCSNYPNCKYTRNL